MIKQMLRCFLISILFATLHQTIGYCQSECLQNFLDRETPLLEPGRDSMLVYLTKVKNKKPRKKIHLLTIWYDSLTRTETLQYQDTKHASWNQFRRIRRFDKNLKIIEEAQFSVPYRKDKITQQNFTIHKSEYNSEGLLILSEVIDGFREMDSPANLDTIRQSIEFYAYKGNTQQSVISKYIDYSYLDPGFVIDTLTISHAFDGSGHLTRTITQNRNTTLDKIIFQYHDNNCILRIDSSWQHFSGHISKFLETDRYHSYFSNDTIIGTDHIQYSFRHWDQQKSTTLTQIKYTQGNLLNRMEEYYPHHVRKSGFHPYLGGQTKSYQFYNDKLVRVSSGRLKIEGVQYEGDVPRKFTVYSDRTYHEEALWIEFE